MAANIMRCIPHTLISLGHDLKNLSREISLKRMGRSFLNLAAFRPRASRVRESVTSPPVIHKLAFVSAIGRVSFSLGDGSDYSFQGGKPVSSLAID